MPDFTYVYRPAKHIVRLMMVEACKRLWPFGATSDYAYIGFGGLEYLDFELIRRQLGINKMVSIEHDTSGRPRYLFNIPFADVELISARASAALPSLPLEGRRIVWLDYEGGLCDEFIDDANQCVQRLWPSSVLIVTLNAQPAKKIADRINTLAEFVGNERVPIGLTNEALGGWGLAAAQRTILTDALTSACSARGDGSSMQKLFDFQYRDGARMQTIGFLLLGPTDRRLFDQCQYGDLDFVVLTGDPITIEVPVLTPREVLHLTGQLPLQGPVALSAPGLSGEDAKAFQNFYRWYPPVRNL